MTDRTCTCGEPITDTRTICARCENQLSHHLGDMAAHRQELVVALTRQVRMAAANDGGRGSSLALDWKRMGERHLDTLKPEELRRLVASLPPARPAADAMHAQRALLVAWCRLLVEELDLGYPPRDSVRAMSLHLEAHLPVLHTHPAAPELVAEVRDLVRQILKVIDTPTNRMRVNVGPCPEDDETGDPCIGHVEAVVPRDESVPPMMRCMICRAEWDATQWSRTGVRILRRQGRPTMNAEAAEGFLRQIGVVA